jgi:hypothetical protein
VISLLQAVFSQREWPTMLNVVRQAQMIYFGIIESFDMDSEFWKSFKFSSCPSLDHYIAFLPVFHQHCANASFTEG